LRAVDIIAKKRDCGVLSKAELRFLIQGFIDKSIADYQMSAFLMACYLNGMSNEETFWLTEAMVNSGRVLDLSLPDKKIVDKHSSGGVGDKTTLVLIPLVSSAGLPIFKMSGHGLGHTGGTLDKLESIPGFKVVFSPDKAKKIMRKVGAVIVSASKDIAPADKEIYALRDVTGTVECLPLIASSIMSKKIAGGADAIVLDVKFGSGALIKDLPRARRLAKLMVKIGNKFNRETVASITNMNQPLGHAVGNTIEVKESIRCLSGNGPGDLEEICLELGAHMLVLGDISDDINKAKATLKDNLNNGKALEKFKEIIFAQGGNPEACDNPALLPQPKYKKDIMLNDVGYVNKIDAGKIGLASMILGAGRTKKDEPIDFAAGIYVHKKIGDALNKGDDKLATIYWSKDSVDANEAEETIISAYKISKTRPNPQKLIYEVIG
jgi:pyrimidine-nucleoside phosphorylase